MAKKNRNIRQRPDEQYPEPGIPADEGWKSMEALLGTAMPSGSKPQPRFPLFSLIATALGLAGLALFVILKNSPDPLLQSTENDSRPEMFREKTQPGTVTSGSHAAAPSGEETGGTIPHSAHSYSPGVRENTALRKKTITDHILPEESVTNDTKTTIPGKSDAASESPGLRSLNRQRTYRLSELSGMQLPVPKSPDRRKEPETGKANITGERFNWGLQWMANFPLTGRKAYVSDLKKQCGAYILAIPGIWISRELGGRQDIVVSLRPYFDYYSKNEIFFQNSPADSPIDTLTSPSPSRAYPEAHLLKLRSSSITAEYHYRLAGNLRVGGELSYQHHWNALANIRRFSPSGFSPATDSLEWLGRADDFWKYLRPRNVTAGLSLTYHTSSVSLGGSIVMPVFPTANDPYGSSRPLNSRIFIRWQLNQPKKDR